jgi:hypothetical protein
VPNDITKGIGGDTTGMIVEIGKRHGESGPSPLPFGCRAEQLPCRRCRHCCLRSVVDLMLLIIENVQGKSKWMGLDNNVHPCI